MNPFLSSYSLQEYPFGRKNPPNSIGKAPYVLHEKSDNEGDTDSSEDGNLYDSNYISENMAGLLHLVFVQTFFFTNNVFAYPRLESEHFDNVQDRVQWARLPRHDNAFQRVLVLSDFFRLLNICFCLPHRRLRTRGLRNRQQCAYQVVRSLNVFFIFVFLMSHLCLFIPSLIDHLCWVMSMLDMPMSASP